LWDGGVVDQSLCWPTGERETWSDHTFTLIAYGADGTLCFTQKPKGATGTYAFYDSSGQEVATFRYINGSDQVEVSCEGLTYQSPSPLECSTVLGRRGGCNLGFCPR
jgi:hypothetical protein